MTENLVGSQTNFSSPAPLVHGHAHHARGFELIARGDGPRGGGSRGGDDFDTVVKIRVDINNKRKDYERRKKNGNDQLKALLIQIQIEQDNDRREEEKRRYDEIKRQQEEEDRQEEAELQRLLDQLKQEKLRKQQDEKRKVQDELRKAEELRRQNRDRYNNKVCSLVLSYSTNQILTERRTLSLLLSRSKCL